MATWIILIGVVLLVAILGGALFLVFVFTRDRTGAPTRLPGVRRFHSGAPGQPGNPGPTQGDPPA